MLRKETSEDVQILIGLYRALQTDYLSYLDKLNVQFKTGEIQLPNDDFYQYYSLQAEIETANATCEIGVREFHENPSFFNDLSETISWVLDDVVKLESKIIDMKTKYPIVPSDQSIGKPTRAAMR